MTRNLLDGDPLFSSRNRVRWLVSLAVAGGELCRAARYAALVATYTSALGDELADDADRPTTATDRRCPRERPD